LLIGAGLFAVKMKDNWSLSPVASDKTSSGPWKKAAGGSGDKEATGGASDASPVGEPAKPDKPGKPSSKEAENALKAVRAYLQKKEGNRNVRIVKEYPPESLEGGVFDYTDLKGTFRYPLLNYLESSWPTEPIFDCEVRQFDILNRPMPGQDLTNFVPKYVCNYRLSLGVRVHYEVDLGFGRWEPFDEVFVVSTESRVVGSTKSRNFQKGVPTGKHDPQFDKSISDADYKKQVEQTLLKSYLDRRL
jgi:hypothetical protein